jgi:hypothetical protein
MDCLRQSYPQVHDIEHSLQVLTCFRWLMTGYLFEYASAAKGAARMSRLLLHLLVRFSVPK